MNEKCRIHPYEKAISFCFSCKAYYCSDCLDEGVEHYYCRREPCQKEMKKESSVHAEVNRSMDTDNPKLLIDGKAMGFCEKCIAETNANAISKSIFDIQSAVLVNEREPCDTCGSVIMDLKKPMVVVPFSWRLVGSYRIIKRYELDPDALYLHRNKFISRALGEDENEKIDYVDWFRIKGFIEHLLNVNRDILSIELFDAVAAYIDDDEYESAFESLFLEFMQTDLTADIGNKNEVLVTAMSLYQDQVPTLDENFLEKLAGFLEAY